MQSVKRWRSLLNVALVSTVALGSSATTAFAQDEVEPAYSIVALDVMEGDNTSNAYGVNDDGVVVGDSMSDEDYVTVGVIVSGDEIEALPVDTEGFGYAGSAINNEGMVAGFLSGDMGSADAVIWADGELTRLPSLGGESSYALGLNDEGQVVGWSAPEAGAFGQHAALWDGDEVTDLGVLAEGARSSAYAINSDGLVVGSSTTGPDADMPAPMVAIAWEGDGMTELPSLGGPDATAYDVNDEGVIVGASTTGEGQFFYGTGTHAVVWVDGEATDLGVLGDGERSFAEAINADGVIVGMSSIEPGESMGEPGENHACVWIDGEIYDLNALIPADSGWILDWAYDINDEGVIVGAGWLDGERRGFILTPED